MAQYIESNDIKKIDLVKIDVEMHEPEVIEGFGKYLQLFRPVVFIEILTEKVADELNKLIGNDFTRLHLLGKDNVQVVPEFKFRTESWDYIFFHKDMEDKIRQYTTLVW